MNITKLPSTFTLYYQVFWLSTIGIYVINTHPLTTITLIIEWI